MFWLIHIRNQFDPTKFIKEQREAGVTVRDVANSLHEGKDEFDLPTICLLNSKPLLRVEWEETVLKDNDILCFSACVGIVLEIIAVAVLLVVSIAITLLMPIPKVNQDQDEADTVYSLKGASNAMRLSQPIEVNYGKNRIYPSYAGRPYYEYRNNNQFLFALLCVGQGEYDIETVQIGDTDIVHYQEAEFEIIPPGEAVTLFPTNVYTSPEAGGQDLLGPNEPGYPDEGGWTGPFVVCPANQVVVTIEIDIALPQGLYVQTDEGGLAYAIVVFTAQKRLIDNSGNPLSGWTTLVTSGSELIMATNTPQRRTYKINVTQARYEVRIRRVSDKDTSSRAGNTLQWEGMRGWLVVENHWGNVTLLAVKVQATNNLNNQTSQLINCIATRKLSMRDQETGEWGALTATRSIVWAFVDMFRASYGGRIADDIFFDWDTLYTLDALYADRGDYFDWTFRDPSTVWEAAQMIALAGRAIPLISGSLISLKRDDYQTVPVALFNQENIVVNSLTYGIKLWVIDEYDSLEVEYIEPASGYVKETVLCILPGDDSLNPDKLILNGILDRTRAYHEGMYRLGCNRYLRETIQFQTGLEGYIPTYGDLIAVTTDLPLWGQSGYVLNAEKDANDFWHLWLTEPLTWTEGVTHQMLLRTKTGGLAGPYACVQAQDPLQIQLQTTETIEFLLDGLTEPTMFMFGPVGEETKMLKVTAIEPNGKEIISITCVNNSSLPYSFDNLVAPALGDDVFAPLEPDLPTVEGVTLAQINSSVLTMQISWPSAFGAKQYVIQTSYDNSSWSAPTYTVQTSLLVAVVPGIIYVRVAGINVGQGPYATASIAIGPLAGVTFSTPWDALDWAITWINVLGENGWQVRVYDHTTSLVLKRTTNLTDSDPRAFTYTYANAISDGNVHRHIQLQVDVKFDASDGSGPALSGTPVVVEMINPIPAAPTLIFVTLLGIESDGAHYQINWVNPADADLIELKLWVSDTSGFDPSISVPDLDFTAGSPGSGVLPGDHEVAIPIDSNGDHPDYFFRIAIFDVWGSELSTNVTDEQTIPAIDNS